MKAVKLVNAVFHDFHVVALFYSRGSHRIYSREIGHRFHG